MGQNQSSGTISGSGVPNNSSVTTVTTNIKSPSSKKYWGPQTGIDYPGNDLQYIATSNPDLCATNCDNNPQCVGYLLGTDGPNCWLKSSFQNPTPSSVRTASVKPGQPAPPGLPQKSAAPPVGYTAGATATYGESVPWTYQGCFNDGTKGQPGPRVLKNQIGQVNSASECQKLAMQKGYNVFGLQFNGECWADTDVAYASQGTRQNCTSLGPAWGNQVYTSPKFNSKAANGAPPVAAAPVAPILSASPPVAAARVAAILSASPPVAAAPVAAILAASPPASASQVASCLRTLQSCIAVTPDASAPATGTSHYTLEGASFAPIPTFKKTLNLFLAFLVVFFAMLMMMKNK